MSSLSIMVGAIVLMSTKRVPVVVILAVAGVVGVGDKVETATKETDRLLGDLRRSIK